MVAVMSKTRGRPVNTQPRDDQPRINLPTTAQIKDAMERLAQLHFRSLSGECNAALEAWINMHSKDGAN